MSTGKIALIILSLIYVISPFDLIPESLFGPAGLPDDLVVFAFMVYMILTGRSPLPFMKFFKQQEASRGQETGPWKTGRDASHGTGSTGRRAGPENGFAEDGYARQSGKDPYHILEIPPDATFEAIKKSYREKAAQYHPDKVSHLGKEFQEIAHRKFVDIQWAYDELKVRHAQDE